MADTDMDTSGILTPDPPETRSTRTTMLLLKPNKPSKFTGTRDHATVENWIASVNSYFALTNARPPYVFHYLNTIFAGEAAIWFRYHFKEDKADTLTWEEVREALRSYFIPPNKDRRLQDQWAALRQNSTVEQYISQFCELVMQLPSMDQKLLLDKFMRGLKPKTKIELELKDPQDLQQAFRLADRFDTIVYRRNWNNTDKHTDAAEYDDNRGEPMQIDAIRTHPWKKKSPRQTTQSKLPKLSDEERTHLKNLGACYRCRQVGHMARECTSQTGKGSPSGNSRRQ
jgi:hypothetical protein